MQYFYYVSFFTVTGINNTLYSKSMIAKRKINSKLLLVIFQINSISLMSQRITM